MESEKQGAAQRDYFSNWKLGLGFSFNLWHLGFGFNLWSLFFELSLAFQFSFSGLEILVEVILSKGTARIIMSILEINKWNKIIRLENKLLISYLHDEEAQTRWYNHCCFIAKWLDKEIYGWIEETVYVYIFLGGKGKKEKGNVTKTLRTEGYIIIASIILQISIFHIHNSIDYLSYKVSIMWNSDDSALVLGYSLLLQHRRIQRISSYSLQTINNSWGKQAQRLEMIPRASLLKVCPNGWLAHQELIK